MTKKMTIPDAFEGPPQLFQAAEEQNAQPGIALSRKAPRRTLHVTGNKDAVAPENAPHAIATAGAPNAG
jgi:hypothetical protein